MRSDSLVVTFPGMTVESVQIREHDENVRRLSARLTSWT